jgi:hypothetical protein
MSYLTEDFNGLTDNNKTIELAEIVLLHGIERKNKKIVLMGFGLLNCVHYKNISPEKWAILNPITLQGKAIIEDTTTKRLENNFTNAD